MTQRALRYPTTNARLIRKESGPPMFRMLGYADQDNRWTDVAFPEKFGFIGPYGKMRLHPNQIVSVGPGRFGCPMGQLPYTTYYWDDNAYPYHSYVDGRTLNRMHCQPLKTRPQAECFPERAVPGSGVNSQCADSGCLCYCRLPLFDYRCPSF